MVLCSLDLAGCIGIKDEAMQSLCKLENLQKLNINQCKHVSDIGAAALSTLASIRDIFVLSTGITQQGLQVLQDALGLQPAPLSPCHLLATA